MTESVRHLTLFQHGSDWFYVSDLAQREAEFARSHAMSKGADLASSARDTKEVRRLLENIGSLTEIVIPGYGRDRHAN